MTSLKSIAERERDKRIAWDRVKMALIEYLLASQHVGSKESQLEEYKLIQKFTGQIDERKP